MRSLLLISVLSLVICEGEVIAMPWGCCKEKMKYVHYVQHSLNLPYFHCWSHAENFPVPPHLGEQGREFFILEEWHVFQAGLTMHNIHSKLYLIFNMSLSLTYYFKETNSKPCRHVGLSQGVLSSQQLWLKYNEVAYI